MKEVQNNLLEWLEIWEILFKQKLQFFGETREAECILFMVEEVKGDLWKMSKFLNSFDRLASRNFLWWHDKQNSGAREEMFWYN